MARAVAAPRSIAPWKTCGIFIFLLAVGAQTACAVEVKRVLIVHSYGRDDTSLSLTVNSFRSALAERWGREIAFYDADLESGQNADSTADGPIVQSLQSRFATIRPDLVVTVAAPASSFYLRHRDELFPNVPVQVLSLEDRLIAKLPLRAGDGVMALHTDLTERLKQILALLPQTTKVVVVLGDSPLERYWIDESRAAFAPFERQVTMEWLNGLTLPQIKKHVAMLDKGSVVYAGPLHMDASGAPLQRQSVIEELAQISKAPVFGFYETDFGHGVVGGSLIPQLALGRSAADMGVHALAGEIFDRPIVETSPTAVPLYDWRALQRWNIDEASLPADGIVRFRPPSIWAQHPNGVATVATALILQAILIAGLIAQRRRLSRARREQQAMSGRLLTAHEDERRRLARELHDDLTQRLARLAIDAARLELKSDKSTAPPCTVGWQASERMYTRFPTGCTRPS